MKKNRLLNPLVVIKVIMGLTIWGMGMMIITSIEPSFDDSSNLSIYLLFLCALCKIFFRLVAMPQYAACHTVYMVPWHFGACHHTPFRTLNQALFSKSKALEMFAKII